MSQLFWITGLSGSGKTTFAKILTERLGQNKRKAVLIDGDVIREIFGYSSDYSAQSRLEVAYKYSKLSAFLVNSGIDVVCSTISLFHEIHDWNRSNIGDKYIEILIKTEMSELIKRDSKQIYSRAKNGELKNVVGIDIEAEFPKNPNLILDNPSIKDLQNCAESLIRELK